MTQPYRYPMRSKEVMRQELEDANIELGLNGEKIYQQAKAIRAYRRALKEFAKGQEGKDYVAFALRIIGRSSSLLKKYK